MQRAFHLALHTGLRFSDTQLERRRVRGGQLVIEEPKGGRSRAFAIPIYPEIKEMIDAFITSGERWLWELPQKTRALTGLLWTRFFREIGLPHLCFHCTRVTFITRGMTSGVSEGMMMKMVNHGSTEVHRVYQRAGSADIARVRAQISIPTPPSTTEEQNVAAVTQMPRSCA